MARQMETGVVDVPVINDGRPGSINVSSILTGKLIAKVQAAADPRTSLEKRTAEALSGASWLTLQQP